MRGLGVSKREGLMGASDLHPLGDQTLQLLTSIPEIVNGHGVVITLWINDCLLSNECDRGLQALKASNCVQPAKGVPSQTTSLHKSLIESNHHYGERFLPLPFTSVTIGCQWDQRAIVLPPRDSIARQVARVRCCQRPRKPSRPGASAAENQGQL